MHHPKPATSLFHTLALMTLVSIRSSAAWSAEGPVLYFPADGNLTARDDTGKTLEGSCGNRDTLRYVEGRRGQGVYLPEGETIALTVSNFNPKEGTLSFWFRPDWSPNNYTPQILFEIHADPAYRMMFRKGWTSPDTCYMLVGMTGDFAMAFGAHNLFTARTWRHYALRWSASRGRIQFVVDGEARGESGPMRMGSFKCGVAGPIKASLLLRGSARGAFDEVKVFDRYLEVEDIVKEAGLTRVARYLQEQVPPPGGASSNAAVQEVSYVDPVSGRKVTVPVIRDEDRSSFTEYSGQSSTYNPARMPDLTPTPHTRWAKPLAGGKLRVLFVMPTGFYNEGSPLREAVELWQRVDMECDVTNQPDPSVLNKDYDVIAVTWQGWSPGGEGRYYGEQGWGDINETLRNWIVDRVKNGRSGLVLAYPIPPRMDSAIDAFFSPRSRLPSETILRGFPTAAMHRVDMTGEKRYEKVYELEDTWFQDPKDLSESVVEVYGDGKIRAVKLNYKNAPWGNTMAFTPDTALNAAATDVHYDHWMVLAARALFYAAGRTPSARIASTNVAAGDWRISVEGLTAPARLWYRGQDAWGRIYAQGEAPVQKSGEVAVRGLRLPPRCFVDLLLKNTKGEALDWYCAATPPPSETRILGIRVDKDSYEKGETVRGVVEVKSPTPGPCVVEVYLSDHEGRRLVRQKLTVTPDPDKTQEASFALAIPESSDSLLMRVEALLLRDGRIVDSRGADCSVPKKQFDGFYAGMYGSAVNRFFNRTARKWFSDEFGVDFSGRSGPHTFANLAKENLGSFEYTTHLGYPHDEKSFGEWMEDWDQFFPKNLWCVPEQTRRFRPIFYSLGEEHYMLMGSTANPKANARFREHIKEKYGSLERLNSVWGTKYASWEEVKMLTPDIVDMLKIKFDVPNFENRRFMEKLFADKHAYLANYFRKLDPYAEVGIHVGWDLWMGRGYDYWLLSRGLDAMMGYGGVQNQYIRSFFKKPYGCWFHYALGSIEDARWYPWYMLMSGEHGYGWYTLTPEVWGATTADLQLSSDFKACKDEFKDAGDLGDLLVHTRYQDNQVAVHYSQDSFQAGVPDMSWVHTSFTNLLFDGGVPFKFVSYEQVAKGELLSRRFPVFLMPHSISLSPEEAKSIREYVNAGGVVWADVLPGTFNQFGQQLAESQLKDVFAGLKDATLSGGQAVKVGTFGKGKVILGDIGNYSYDRNVGSHLRAQSLLDRAVELAGIQRAARVTNQSDGTPANGVWTAGYATGGQRYVIVTRDWQLADRSLAKVRVGVGRKGHIYEMRTGRYHGYSDSVATELEPARGKVFAVFPYMMRSLSARLINAPERGQDLLLSVKLAANGEVGQEDFHLIRLRVTAPDGKEVKALRRTKILHGVSGQIRLPVAYDDARGKWTVHLSEITAHLQTSVEFVLR